MFEHGRDLFHELFGTDDSLRQWWGGARSVGGLWYENHLVIASEPDATKRIPYGIHGDDAGMHGSSQTLCVTWGP